MRVPRTFSLAMGSTVAGALTSAAVLLFIFPAISREPAHSLHNHVHEAVAVPLPDWLPHGGPPSFYSEMAEVNARMHEGMNIAPGGDVNQDFIRMMIPHHQGAIDMALVLLKYQPEERLRRLAQSIIVEQSQEIVYMRTLLTQSLAEPSQPAKRDAQ
jgi:hypothetical protein